MRSQMCGKDELRTPIPEPDLNKRDLERFGWKSAWC
jgi:hypothetical protein